MCPRAPRSAARPGQFFGFPQCHTLGQGDPYLRNLGPGEPLPDHELNRNGAALNCSGAPRAAARSCLLSGMMVMYLCRHERSAAWAPAAAGRADCPSPLCLPAMVDPKSYTRPVQALGPHGMFGLHRVACCAAAWHLEAGPREAMCTWHACAVCGLRLGPEHTLGTLGAAR